MRAKALGLAAGILSLALLWSMLWPFATVPAGRYLGFVIVLALAWPYSERPRQPPREDETPPSMLPFLIGLAVAIASLAVLELRQPFYFVRDDSFAQFGPVVLHGCRSFFHGTFPTWNAWQGLGQPTTTTGVYALTYPLTYLAWLIAELALRNEMATLDVFSIMHILLGYAVSYRLLQRQLGVTKVIAALGALSFSLCGFFLVCGRGWYYMVPLALWLPLIAERALNQLRAPGLVSALGTGCALGLFFHAGNAQMWMYSVLFFAMLAACVMAFRVALAKAGWLTAVSLVVALGVAVVVAAPLLIPQASFAKDVTRAVWGNGILNGLGSLVFPASIVPSPHPNGWDDWGKFHHPGELYFVGGLTALAAFWGLGQSVRYCLLLARGRLPKFEQVALALFSLGLLVALELALGGDSWLWPALATKPVFDKFSNPFKFLPFIALFSVAAGALVIDGAERALRLRALRVAFSGGVACVTLVLTGIHIRDSDSAFFTYGDRPYPEVAWLATLNTSEGRIASIYPDRLQDKGYVAALGHNFATVYERASFESYEPLVNAKPESQHEHVPARYRDYGVSHIAQFDDLGHDDLVAIGAERIGNADRITLYSLPGAKPLAWQGNDESPTALPVHWLGNGFELTKLNPAPSPLQLVLHVNVLERRGFVARDDNGAPLTIGRDPLGRLLVRLEPSSRSVKVVYQPIFRFGYLLIGLNALLFALLLKASPFEWLRVRVSARLPQKWRAYS